MSNRIDRFIARTHLLGATDSTTTGTTAVSGTYTFGSAGNAVGFRFVAPAAVTLVDVLFFVSAVAGTGGTVAIELRNTASNGGLPGSTVHATTSVATANATKWYKATFGTPFTLVAGTTYWITFTSNDATNFATITRAGGPGQLDQGHFLARAFTTTNGFSTVTTISGLAPIVLIFGDGSTLGSAYTTNTTDTSNTRERGLKVLGLDAPLVVSGAVWNPATNANTLKVYDSVASPGGTPLLSVSIDSAAAAIGAIRFATTTLQASTVYRAVLGFSANSTVPGFYQIQDDTTYTVDIEKCGFAAYGLAHTIDNGAGGWTDSTDRFERLALVVSQQSASFVGRGLRTSGRL